MGVLWVFFALCCFAFVCVASRRVASLNVAVLAGQAIAEAEFRFSESLCDLREVFYLQACVHALRCGEAPQVDGDGDAAAQAPAADDHDYQRQQQEHQLRDACAALFVRADAALRAPARRQQQHHHDALLGLKAAMASSSTLSSSSTPTVTGDSGYAAFQRWSYSLNRALAQDEA